MGEWGLSHIGLERLRSEPGSADAVSMNGRNLCGVSQPSCAHHALCRKRIVDSRSLTVRKARGSQEPLASRAL
jgi:hypothetical protein